MGSLLIFLSLTSLFLVTQAADTLTPGQSLTDGNTLISAGQVFEIGFFSPESSTNRYVGIWYHNFSTDTVLWVANREAPVRDKSGSLTISADGNLVLVDATKEVLWSSKVSSLMSNHTIATLLDSGNLQLKDSVGMVWQSFDYPTDTYLQGMKVGLNMTSNVNQLFTSWKSSIDPAVGNYSMGIDPDRSTQILLWDGTKPRWRSGMWNGQVFIGVQGMVPMYVYGFKLSIFQQEGKMYFYYSNFNASHRYVLTWDGLLKHLIWKDDTQVWYQYWAEPTTDCEFYNKCGNYGSCTDENMPICTCLQGFVPKSNDEWNSGNWTNGCVRRTPLLCERNSSNRGQGEADGFLQLEGVKLPDLSDWDQSVDNNSGCEQTCLANCSCKAYSYVMGIGCLRWGVDLVDIHMFSSGGEDLYLRLAGSELDKKKKNMAVIIIVVIVLAAIISLGCLYLVWKYKTRVKAFIKLRKNKRLSFSDQSRDRVEPNVYSGGAFEVRDEENDRKNQQCPLVSFDSIVAATGNFSRTNLLGEGGFGPVYKGTLHYGQEIAVKRLSSGSRQGLEEFKNEVILISKLQHRNLVRLLGCCIQGEEKILIYEYMPNRSLDAFLFDTMKKGLLDWKTRYNIIEGIARGLLYLHRDSRLRVIHRDLKVSNILLDEEMNPKISDFGMARIFGHDDNETNTKRVVGTYGYMSPEYAMHGLFSVKSDVYSFGVLLLEIVSGKKNSNYCHPDLSLNLLSYAWKLWNEDNVMEFADPSIRDSCSLTEVSRCINVGLLCVQDRANDRPTMSLVVVMLESGTIDNTLPRQPTFAAEKNPSDTESSTFDLRLSANASITRLTGR